MKYKFHFQNAKFFFILSIVGPPPPPPPPLPLSAGELNLLPNFQKKGEAWQDLNFERGFAGKEEVTFFRGGLQLLQKNTLKSESI